MCPQRKGEGTVSYSNVVLACFLKSLALLRRPEPYPLSYAPLFLPLLLLRVTSSVVVIRRCSFGPKGQDFAASDMKHIMAAGAKAVTSDFVQRELLVRNSASQLIVSPCVGIQITTYVESVAVGRRR